MKLYYKKNNSLEYIGDFGTEEDALKEIKEFWNDLGYYVPYFRLIKHEEYTTIDFGSHTLFYRLYNDGCECDEL